MILYTKPNCPICDVIKTKLAQAGVEYTLNQNEEGMEALGIDFLPVLEKDGELLNVTAIINWLKEEQAK